MPLLVLECLYLLLDRFGGPQDGFFGFSSGGYLEGGEKERKIEKETDGNKDFCFSGMGQ